MFNPIAVIPIISFIKKYYNIIHRKRRKSIYIEIDKLYHRLVKSILSHKAKFMRILFYFAWLGPLFCILGCTVGILFIPDNYIDGIMYISFFSIITNRIFRPFINCRKLVNDEFIDPWIAKRIIGIKDYDLQSFKEALIRKEKEYLYTPVVGFLGFLCFVVYIKINWQEASFIKYLPLFLVFVSIFKLIEIFFFNKPNLKKKQQPNIIVQ
jgi:hypothetical protein